VAVEPFFLAEPTALHMTQPPNRHPNTTSAIIPVLIPFFGGGEPGPYPCCGGPYPCGAYPCGGPYPD
jgi:hypothetical protein